MNVERYCDILCDKISGIGVVGVNSANEPCCQEDRVRAFALQPSFRRALISQIKCTSIRCQGFSSKKKCDPCGANPRCNVRLHVPQETSAKLPIEKPLFHSIVCREKEAALGESYGRL
jgi:hypothetical protein